MLGTPYERSATIPGLVRVQLRHLSRTQNIEVVNLGAAAINSNVLADLLPAALQMEPDVILLYLGHNEFYGPDGIGAPWIEKQIPGLISFKYTLRGLAVSHLLVRLLKATLPRAQSIDTNLMRQVSRGSFVRLEDEDAAWVIRRFAANMDRILSMIRGAHVPVIVSGVTSNMLFPPFATSPVPDSAVIARCLERGDFLRAQRLLDSARTSDTTNAFVNYTSGRLAMDQNRWSDASTFFEKLRDGDLLKFRAPSPICSVIEKSCRDRHITYLAMDSIFRALSFHGITNGALFTEHVHPNVRGYDVVARTFVSSMLGSGVFRPDAGTAMLPFDRDSLRISWVDEALGDLSLINLSRHWPFNGFSPICEALPGGDSVSRDIVFKLYTRKIGWTDATSQFALHCTERGDLRNAVRAYGALVEEYPAVSLFRYRLGDVLRRAGASRPALAEYREAARLAPAEPEAYTEAGLLENNLGELTAAASDLRKALELSAGPRNAQLRATIFYGLAATAANSGDFNGADSLVHVALTISPNFKDAIALRRQIQTVRPSHSRHGGGTIPAHRALPSP